MTRAAAFTLWWLGLLGFWLLLVGTRDWIEVVAGVCAALLGAALAVSVRPRLYLEPALLGRASRLPWRILADFALLAWALLLHLTRVRPVRGAWVEVPLPGAHQPGRRAVAAALGSLTPNTVVADVDRERNVAFVHTLVPERRPSSVP